MVLEVFFNKSISNYYEIDDTITLILTEDIDNLRFIKSKMEQINEILIASCDERNINQIKQLFDYNKKLPNKAQYLCTALVLQKILVKQ